MYIQEMDLFGDFNDGSFLFLKKTNANISYYIQ